MRVWEMELFLIICFFCFLFSIVSSTREVPLISCSSQFEAAMRKNVHNSSGIHLPLHHPSSPCSPAALRRQLPFSEVLRHDASRVTALLRRISTSSATVPLSAGSAVGVGNYVAHISIGTPARPYAVVIDTGSSLSWLQCLPCKVSCHEQVDPIFDPAASSTYRTVPCSSASCSALPAATLNPSACSRAGACIYQATYGDSSFSLGYLSNDVLSLSKSSPASLTHFVFGCGQDNEGLFGKSAGIIGLAKNTLSLLSQLAPAYGTAFSYCLPSSSATGYLSFGAYTPQKDVAFTPMAANSLDKTLYFLKLKAIAVAGNALSVSPALYDATPTIIDSGTVITRLPEEVYAALSGAVVAAVGGKLKRAAAYSLLDTCYKGSAAAFPTPEVTFVFDGGAVVRLPARNVMIDVEKGTTCLAFAGAKGVAIIGNRQQQTFNVIYDVGKKRIGFGAGGCG